VLVSEIEEVTHVVQGHTRPDQMYEVTVNGKVIGSYLGRALEAALPLPVAAVQEKPAPLGGMCTFQRAGVLLIVLHDMVREPVTEKQH
jgi:hypothetical protein